MEAFDSHWSWGGTGDTPRTDSVLEATSVDHASIAGLSDLLRRSIEQQERELRSTLILNPVENIPFEEDIAVASGPLHGLYASDKVRGDEARKKTQHQFANRNAMASDMATVYAAFASELGAEAATLRTLSGLHAHIVLFMASARQGDSILLLPTAAGGHMSGLAIVERLGLRVTEMVVDEDNLCVDIEATAALLADDPPDYVLVDRSEGLVVEDFSRLARLARRASVFDASQSLTNVICGDHPNPFDQGFDLIISSVHKNFPGPQKALLATKRVDDLWTRVTQGVSTFVSNFHATSTYAAGLTLARRPWLDRYSSAILDVAVALERELALRGVPVVRRDPTAVPTHHVWIQEPDQDAAFTTFEALERCGLLVNYRLLPYGLGYGLRLGTTAAVRVGLRREQVPELAELVASIREEGATPQLQGRAATFCRAVWAAGPEHLLA